MTFDTITRIKIDAPDAGSAFQLERRLSHMRPAAVGRGAAWQVELDDAEGRTEEVVAAVQHWLRDAGLRSTTVHVDGAPRVVAAHPGGGSLGAGYDGAGVLEHEP